MKVIVSQYGARRRYLIPKVLEEHNLLQKLYTDSHSQSVLGRLATILKRVGIHNLISQRLINRVIGLPSSKIISNDWLQIQIFLKHLFRRPNKEIMNLIFEGSSKYFIRRGIEDANWLYTMFIENIEFTKFAKSKGLKVVADVYENPFIFRELVDELNNAEFECIRHTAESHIVQAELREKYLDELLKTVDKLLVPSEYVKNCLKRSPFYDESKINVIPYVSSVSNSSYANNPQIGRIIWIGNDPVRKGLLYANRAIRDLLNAGYKIDFRAIGPLPKELEQSDYFSNINFRGYLSKTELKDEFNSADMFVFPTLAEGFAGVLLEAASFGVPVITTNESGCDSEFPGIIVPAKDTESIKNSIKLLFNNRRVRDDISHKLFEYSQKQSVKSFGEKLIRLFD